MTSVSSTAPRQLHLGIQLRDDATFVNFYAPDGHSNRQAVQALQGQLQTGGEPFIYLSGPPGAGVSHLLQAACHYAGERGWRAQYLPLAELAAADPAALLEGLEDLDLVCLDGLQAVAGQPAWERALFVLYNSLRDSGRRLVVAASQGPRELPLQLADLQSRLNWGLLLPVQPLDDEDKCRALQLRARARGFVLNDEVTQFILHRAPRSMHELFATLRRLDDASLAEQRRLTIPFVKQVLGY